MSNRTKIVAIPKTTTTIFSPTSITGCSLWLDGADPAGTGIVPASGNLATWVDKSGGGINAIAGTSTYPQFTTSYLNGLGVVGLTNSADYFTVANNFNTSSLAYIFVMKPTAANTGGYCAILSTDTPNAYGRSIALNNMNFQFEYYSNFTNTSITTNTTTWYIVSLVFNGTSSITLSYNGTISTYGGSGTGTNTNGLTIGSYNNTSSYTTFNANFYLAEAIVYTSSLTQTQFQTVESYLAQKWGLTSNLAAGHPGITTPVYTITVTLPKQKISSIPKVTFVNYLPTSITGCKVWFDAYDASYTTTGTTVTGWTNKTGNANASTGGGTVSINLATLGGKSSVRFSAGTNYLNVGSLSYSTAYRNQFFVVTVGASGTPYFYLNCDDGICGQCYSWSDGDIEINKSGTLGLRAYPTGFFSSTTIVSICTSSGSNTGIWVNGTNKTLTDNNTGTGGFWSTGSASPTLGGQSGRTTGTTDIYELLQYDGILTTTQRQTIESYLAQKWGLTANLPAGHPGLTTTVYGTTTAAATVRQKIRFIQPAAVIPIFPYSITSGLLAFFSFNNTLADSQNTITLAATGSVSYVAGRITNQAIYLANEANSAASTFAANYLTSSYNITVPFSVSVWFRPTNTNQGSLLSTYNSTAITAYSVNLYINGGSMSAAYNNIQNVGASVGVSVGTWYHAVITVNASNGLTLFVNNSQVGSTITQTPSINGLMIGSIRDNWASYAFSGYLDDYRIYNRVLTGTEIGQIYAGTG